MGQISLSIPQTGLPNSSEDVKVASDLTAIQTLLNGNLDATNLSPSAGILQSQIAAGSSSSFGFTNIATSQSTSSTTFTQLGTADQVSGVVLPANGLIQVWFQATWQESVSAAGSLAIFLGANQLQVATGNGPAVEAAVTGGGTANKAHLVCSSPFGLVTAVGFGGTNNNYSGDVTTGQAVGAAGSTSYAYSVGGSAQSLSQGSVVGGSCDIFAAAGTYTVSVQFKASSGSVTASNRKLFVRTLLFA